MLTLKEFVRRCDELYAYATGPYTRGGMELPTEVLKKETFFFAMCKLHQEDFAQDADHVTLQQMITYFEGCFRKDTSSGKTTQLQAAHEEKCCKANAKCNHSNKTPHQGQGQGRGNQRRRCNDDCHNDDHRINGYCNNG